ncbi:MAG: protein kinase rio1 [Watsoniomyces obsoletus]|nr:MAG: protein kinase rio1 [Watsoniomyces obsoletus]
MRFNSSIKNIALFGKITGSLVFIGPVAWLHLDLDKVRITIAPQEGTQVWAVLSIDSIFETYNIQSAAPNNAINLELPLDQLNRALKSAYGATSASLRLTKKDNIPLLALTIVRNSLSNPTPAGTFNGNDHAGPQDSSMGFGHMGRDIETIVTQEVPVRVLAASSVDGIIEPQCPEPHAHILLPSLVQIKGISDRFTRIAARPSAEGRTSLSSVGPRLELSANMHGSLRLRVTTDALSISSVWTDLSNPDLDPSQVAGGEEGIRNHPSTRMREIGDDGTEAGWATVRIDGREWSKVLSFLEARIVGLCVWRVVGFVHEQVLVLYVYLPTNDMDDNEESVLTAGAPHVVFQAACLIFFDVVLYELLLGLRRFAIEGAAVARGAISADLSLSSDEAPLWTSPHFPIARPVLKAVFTLPLGLRQSSATMVKIKGIDIRVKCNGQFLTEYDDDAGQDDAAHDGPLVKYIEAIPGAKFSVLATLSSEFGYYSANSVAASFQVDNHDRQQFLVGRYPFGVSVEVSSQQYLCKQSSLYKEADLAFGTVVLVDGEDSGQTFSRSQINNLGRISVSFRRSWAIRRWSVSRMAAREIDGPELPEKLLKGQAVTNVLKMVNERTIAQPTFNWQSSPIHGYYGREFQVHIYYRSRRALQTLGCIPRDVSPPILVEEEPAQAAGVERRPEVSGTRNPKSEEGNEEEASRLRARIEELEKADELTRLRARVAELESRQSSPVKPEPGNLLPVKRERPEEGRGGGSPKRRRSQQSPPAFVDLTDD